MFGQGRPITTRRSLSECLALVWRAGLACLAPFLIALTSAQGAETSLQLRIAWGGGAPRQWSGTITLAEGRLALNRPLGIEADEPGSIWVEGNRLEIRQRSPRQYDGVDVFLTAPLDSKLLISMAADPGAPGPVHQEIKLVDLLHKPIAGPLDDRGNRLLVRRAPGDMLRVRFARDSLVFASGERLTVDLKPHLLPVADGAHVRIHSRLVGKISGEEHWSIEQNVNKPAGDSTSPAIIALELDLPEAEGVYDLVIEASERNPLRWNKPIATRHVQMMVVSAQPAPVAADRKPSWTKVLEIDPANPGWTDRLKNWPLLPGWRRGPLGNGQSAAWQHPLGAVMRLNSAVLSGDTAWEAYPLAINKPGQPHLLEVEFPSDVAQTLGISILEPNAAGQVTPIGLDSGVYTSDEPTPLLTQWTKHRLLFWPRTKSPLLLMTARRDGRTAAYGKIRVLSGPANLPPAFHPAFDRSERMFAAYYDRPLFCENFGATESLDSWSGRSLDDWQTFYEGSTRLIEYLNHAGYNGLMLAALADGSTIYPSTLLEPNPLYDTGAFFDSGQDPFRKDVLELLLRLFDREGSKLIPALQFSSPLPALEALLRESEPQTSGIVLVGPDGDTWTARQTPRRGLAPYYNPLNAQVQDAMLAVVREVVERYGRHSAFAGLAVELSANGYAQLPGEAWGFDDATIAAFESDTELKVPGEGESRFAERAQFLLATQRKKAWLEWRAAKLAEFHRRMQQELVAVRPDALFYLAATNMLDTPEAERELRPALPSRGRVDEVLLTVGIDPSRYRDSEGLVFLRPQRITPPGPVAAKSLEMELDRAAELDNFAAGSTTTGALLVHEPVKARLTSFDAKSPFGKEKTSTLLVSQLSPAGKQNRQRFVQSLTRLDCEAIFDGGWLLPLGQQESLEPLIAAYRRLPADRFETLAGPYHATVRTDPVTVRKLIRDGRTYAYFVNDSAWPLSLSMQVALPAGARVDELSGTRRLPAMVGNKWTLELEPFDLLAVRFASKDVRFSQFVVKPPDEVHLELEQRIDHLRRRRAVLENPPPFSGLENSDFETIVRGSEPAHWTVTATPPSSGAARIERKRGYEGTAAVRLTSDRAGASLVSDPLPPPETGRPVSLSVWLRVDNPKQQPRLRLTIEGSVDETPYSPYAFVGAGPNVKPIGSQWSEYILQIDDVPPSGLSPLRVRFDLVGPGEVWIDDVELRHLVFSNTEREQLAKLLELPAFQLQKGRWGECLRELDGYWPRFLLANVPPAQQPLADTASESSPPPPPIQKQATKPGVMERVKDWWRR